MATSVFVALLVRSDARQLMRVSCFVALLSILPVAAAGRDGVAQPHDPISITSDLELLAPDTVSNNGVRRGSGTRADPWVISEWTIQVGDRGIAVSISNVQGYVRIQDLRIEGPAEGYATGLQLVDAAHVEVIGLRTSGNAEPMRGVRSTATFRTPGELGFLVGDPCIDWRGGNISILDVRLRRECGAGILSAHNANVTLRNATLENQALGLGASGTGTWTLQNSTIEASSSGTPSWATFDYAGLGLVLTPAGPASAVLSNLSIVGFRHACISVTSSRNEAKDAFVDADGLRVENCRGSGITTSLAGRIRIRNSHIMGPGNQGIVIGGTNGELERLAIARWDEALSVGASQPPTSVVTASNITFLDNKVNARREGQAELRLDHVWWNTGSFEVGYTVTKDNTAPVPPPYSPSPHSTGTIGPLASFVAAFLVVAFARLRNGPRSGGPV